MVVDFSVLNDMGERELRHFLERVKVEERPGQIGPTAQELTQYIQRKWGTADKGEKGRRKSKQYFD